MNVAYFESAELSDVGLKRKNNEDHCLRIPDKGVFCVADGMGGVVGGDLASERIATILQEVLAHAVPEESETLEGRIALVRKAANQASKWIKNFADEKVIGQMGSTLVTLVLDPRRPAEAVGLHAGDSRLYRFRDGELELLTEDHSAVAALAAKLGRAAESLPAKYQNELLRAVGLNESVELELTPVNVRGGDVFLLCSDGLSRMVADQNLATILKQGIEDQIGARLSTLSVDDLKDPPAFAAALKDPKLPVSIWLRGQLRESTRKDLAGWQGFGEVPSELQQSIIEDVNTVITGASLWDKDRFADMTIRKETNELLGQNPVKEQLACLNRLLLEDAYPAELSRPLDRVARALIDAANAAGGKDNITVVLVKVGDIRGLASASAPDDGEDAQTIAAPTIVVPAPAAEFDTEVTQKTPTAQRPSSDTTEIFEGETPHTPPTHDGNPPRPVPIWIKLVAAGILCVGITLPLLLRTKPETGTVAPGPVAFSKSPAPTETFDANPPPKPAGEVKLPVPPTPPKAAPPSTVAAKRTNVVAAVTRQPSVPPPPATGSLLLDSAPTAADVFLSGKHMGLTPYEVTGLPVGPLTYTLGTLTHTGGVSVVVIANERTATNVVLAQRLFGLDVNSDPPGAEVWMDNRALGKTPTQVRLPAGRQELTLTHSTLNDYPLTVDIKPNQVETRTVRFPRGVLEIHSQPAGATVTLNGKLAGKTPYTNDLASVGSMTLNLALKDYVPTNRNVRVEDNKRASVNVTLSSGKGTLLLIGNRDGIKVSVDGGAAQQLTTKGLSKVTVNATAAHSLLAEYKGQRKTKDGVRVSMGGTTDVHFLFDEPPAIVAKPRAPQFWTNKFGLVFVKLPDLDFWVGTSRVTPKQYHEVTGSPLPESEIVSKQGKNWMYPTYEHAVSFARMLTEESKRNKDLPSGYERGRFAFPTPGQWEAIVKHADLIKIIGFDSLSTSQELSLNDEVEADGAGVHVWLGRYHWGLNRFVVEKWKNPLSPNYNMQDVSIRLVLRP